MKLKHKILLLFLCIAQLPVLLTGFLSYRISQKSLEQEIVSFLVGTNLLKSTRINHWIEDSVQDLEYVANLPFLKEEFAEKKATRSPAGQNWQQPAAAGQLRHWLPYFQPLVSKGRFIELSLLSPADGIVLFSTDARQEGKIKEDAPYFLNGRDKTFVGNIAYSMTILQPSMVVSTPVKDQQGHLVAVLAGRLNLAELSSIMEERSGLRTTEDTYLVNSQNYFITEPRFGKDYALRKTVYTQGVQHALQGQKGTAAYNDYRGTMVIGAYQYLPERNIAIVTEIDQDEYMAPIQHLQRIIYAIGGIVAILSLLIGWKYAGALLKPLLRLVDAVKKMSADNLMFTAMISGNSEIAQLAQAFASMTRRLQHTLVSRDALQTEIEMRRNTEQRLEEALVQLNRSNQELEQFAYVASHDLQEPLRMVSSYVQLLAERYRDQLDEKAQKYIHYAVDGAFRMQALIQDLLDFSRVSTRGQAFATVDCNELLAQALDNLQTSIQRAGALVSSDRLPVVTGDAVQIVQVFQNLIANSIKFCDKEHPVIHVGAGETEADWLISVRDNGIGIDAKYADKIFVIFQRLHTREEYQGTGIGLAVCKRIIERHGGAVWFESEPGQGAVFYCTFPKKEGGTLTITQDESAKRGEDNDKRQGASG